MKKRVLVAVTALLMGCVSEAEVSAVRAPPPPSSGTPPPSSPAAGIATSSVDTAFACPYGMTLRENGCWTRADALHDGPSPSEYHVGGYPPDLPTEQLRAWGGLFNAFHTRVHTLFAERYLASLEGLPPDTAVNRGAVVTLVDITLAANGSPANVALHRASGVPAFDQVVLSIITQSAPYAPPPESLLEDGQVRFRYDFTRPMRIACSAINATPLLGP